MKTCYKNAYTLQGYHKLSKIITDWPIPFTNFIGIDIGTSIGGFIYMLLQNNARKIYAIDVGQNKLYLNIKYNQKIYIDTQVIQEG